MTLKALDTSSLGLEQNELEVLYVCMVLIAITNLMFIIGILFVLALYLYFCIHLEFQDLNLHFFPFQRGYNGLQLYLLEGSGYSCLAFNYKQ